MSALVHRSADLSADRLYRYALKIVWESGKPLACFVGLNPSTADEFKDDSTIRKCRGFATRWNCGGLVMLNLFAFRATKPEDMLRADDPVGPENTATFLNGHLHLIEGPRIACWGKHGWHRNRATAMKETLLRLDCLRKNADGSPEHPLYIPYETKPIPFNYTARTAIEMLTEAQS